MGHTIVGNVTLRLDFSIIMVLLKGFIWCKQNAVAPKRTWEPLTFISKFRLLKY